MIKEYSMFTRATRLTVARITHSAENTVLLFMVTQIRLNHAPPGRCYLYRTFPFGTGSSGGPVLLEPRGKKCLKLKDNLL